MSQKLPLGRVVGAATTVGTAAADLVSSPNIPNGVAFMAVANILGRDTTTNESVMSTLAYSGKVVAGVLTLDGMLSLLLPMAGTAALLGGVAAIAAGAGTSVKVSITAGVLTKTIEWTAWLDVYLN